jgi:hypothetical protein
MTTRLRSLYPPPSLLASIRGGFDAIANNIPLVLFPVALDLFLWLGPQLRLTQLVNRIIEQALHLYNAQDVPVSESLMAGPELWAVVAERFNVLVALRSYPVGIFSLMAGGLPVDSPFGSHVVWELQTLSGAFFAWFLITVLGIVAGTVYFLAVSQAALSGQVNWGQVREQGRQAVRQVFFLAIFWIGLMLLVGSFLFSILLITGTPLMTCTLILFVGFMLSLLIPLVFSSHGIFVFQHNLLTSIKSSIRLTRMTLPTTSMFILIAVLLSESLDYLWRVPPESSWISLVGILGHAFVTTSLLAASFIYYRDAARWVHSLVNQFSVASMRDARRET